LREQRAGPRRRRPPDWTFLPLSLSGAPPFPGNEETRILFFFFVLHTRAKRIMRGGKRQEASALSHADADADAAEAEAAGAAAPTAGGGGGDGRGGRPPTASNLPSSRGGHARTPRGRGRPSRSHASGCGLFVRFLFWGGGEREGREGVERAAAAKKEKKMRLHLPPPPIFPLQSKRPKEQDQNPP
jgi:hypothetical protein